MRDTISKAVSNKWDSEDGDVHGKSDCGIKLVGQLYDV